MLGNNKVVYVYRDEESRPFYVGMGFMRRAYEFSHGRSDEFIKEFNRVQSVTNEVLYPDIICIRMSEGEAQELEAFLIEEIGLESLTNKCKGVTVAYKPRPIITENIKRFRRYKKIGRAVPKKRKAKPHPYKDMIVHKTKRSPIL